MQQTTYPVDVISVCAADGSIRPLRLRLEDEHQQLRCIRIDEILSVKDVSYVGIEAFVYLCRAVVQDRVWLFELKYMIRSHSWQLLRWGP
jgi:hypothetical protein